MKITITGYSGSGKSTLAGKLAEIYKIPVLHLDSLHWLPNWVENEKEVEIPFLSDFLNINDSWIIEGNYSYNNLDRRLREADLNIQMLFNRFSSLYRVCKRYRKYKGKTRPDMGKGCTEKINAEFVRWVMIDGRTKKTRDNFRCRRLRYLNKTVVLKNQRDIDRFLKKVIDSRGKYDT